MKTLHPNRAPAALAILSLIGLGGLVSYDSARQEADIPALFRFVPANTTAVVFTPNLSRSWEGLAPHLDLVFGRSDTELTSLGGDIRRGLIQKCVFLDHPGRLARYGISPDGAVAVAALDALFGKRRDKDFGVVAVLPVHDRFAFASLLASFQFKEGRVKLSAADIDRKPVKFKVRRVTEPGYGRLCGRQRKGDLATGDYDLVTGDADLEIRARNGTARLKFFPDWLASGRLQLACTAVYKDGGEGTCTCTLKPGDFEVEGTNGRRNCLQSLTIMPHEENIAPNFRPHPMDVAGRQYNGITLPTDPPISVIFPSESLAVLATRPDALAAAVRKPDQNMAFHLNSTGLHKALTLPPQSAGNEFDVLFGSVRIPSLLGANRVLIALQGNQDRLEFQLSMELPRPAMLVLDRLISRDPSTPSKVTALTASQVALLINSRFTPYFLRYVLDYLDGASAGAEKVLGNFNVVLNELKDVDRLDGISLHVVGARDGFPELALAMHLGDPQAAQRITRRLQKRLREARDRAILEKALNTYRERYGSDPDNIRAMQRVPKSDPHAKDREQRSKGPVLHPESESTWQYYTLKGNEILGPKGGLPEEVFVGGQYRLVYDEQPFDYVLPPVTENDLDYRFAEEQFDETDKDKLRKNVNRLCSAYVEDSGILWIGTDAETLRTLFGQGLHRSEASRYAAVLRRSPKGGSPKVALFLQPTWLVDQGLAHPEKGIKEMVGNYLRDFDRYESVIVTLRPMRDRDGLYASAQFVRQ